MKLKSILALGLAGFCVVASAIANESPAPSQAQASATPAAIQKYTCTMHPEVVQDKPGACPKCGMKLVPKVDSGKSK